MCRKLIYAQHGTQCGWRHLRHLICFVFVLSVAVNASAQLLVHYKLDETSGTIAYDSSGKGNDGTIGADPNWVIGVMDGALKFGVDDANSITLPAENMGLRSDTGSVTFWINMSEVAGGINTIWWGGDNTTGGGMGPENEMHIHVEQFVSDIWIGGEICFRTLHGDPIMIHLHSDPEKGDATEPGNAPVNPILVNDSEWHHVAGTWGDDDGNVNLYLDGELLQQAAYITPSYPLSYMYLGQMANGGRTYRGLLDDVQIYGRVVTEEEIQGIMVGELALSYLASLPEPANRAVDVPRDANLKWLGGDTAEKHNVYFGTVFDDVNEASVDDPRGVLISQNQDAVTYDLDLLEYDQTYCWRVDEVEADGTTIHKGAVWSFTVLNFLVVDDFENYDVNNVIYDVWSDYYTNNTGMTVGYFDPPFVEQSIFRSGEQSMPVHYDNDGTVNEGTNYETAGTLTFSEVKRQWADPQDWTRDGVESLSLWFRGYPAYVGGFIEDPAGTYTIRAAGADIWGNSDEFHFAYKEVTGAAAIIAKVESLDNTDPYAKAGVMIRDTLEPDSRNITLLITPENGIRFQFRNTTGGATDREFMEAITAPYWLKLERTSGGLVRAFYSEDGVEWERFNLRSAGMKMPVYVGLAVTSHNVEAVCEAKFSNVSFPDTDVSAQWADQDIGITSNEAEPMYAVLSDSAVVYHEDPNAGLINAWTEWKIDLQSFADLGVDLTRVNSFGIGFGDRNNPQAGGEGTIYVDDIRLYRPSQVEPGNEE